ncbi:hypothetical protein O7983_000137 [Mycoplasmopsis felis]|uniref:hypothetical protein n=1 Tax=Mycoplasmopsis felis TaxID=33923 RepID=UPI003A4DDB18
MFCYHFSLTLKSKLKRIYTKYNTVPPEVPENVTVENNLNTIEIPLNNVHEGLSPVMSDDKVVELSSNTYYLYLIKGEKVDKYLPKKIQKDGKLYNISNNVNQNSLAVTDVS